MMNSEATATWPNTKKESSKDTELEKIEEDIIRIKNTLYGEEAKARFWDDEEEDEDSEDEEQLQFQDSEAEDDWKTPDMPSQFKDSEQAGKLEVGDDLSQTASIFDADSESALENLLYVNRTYQELLQESLQEMELMLMSNRDSQRSIQGQLSTKTKEKRPLRHSGFNCFSIPYFKDSRGYIPPPNEDTIMKMKNSEFDSKTSVSRPWTDKEKSVLMEAIQRGALQAAAQPFMARIEVLTRELRDEELSENLRTAKKTAIKNMQRHISDISSNKDLPLESPDCNYDWLKISASDFAGTRSPRDCELYWSNYLRPSINKSKWTRDEIAKLRNLVVEKGRRDWESIAESMKTGRTALQCFEKYQTKLNDEFRKGRWTEEERKQLTELVESCRIGEFIPWYQVAYYMEGRSPIQIWQHWRYHCDPHIRKGRWAEEEDLLLLTGIWMFGIGNWRRIKQYVPGRTGAQCNERWGNTLNPALKFGDWTAEEDSILLKLVAKHGKKWALITQHLPQRTDNSVSSRWRALSRATKPNENMITAPQAQLAYRDHIYRRFARCLSFILREKGAHSSVNRACLMKTMADTTYSYDVQDPNNPTASIRCVISKAMLQWSLSKLKEFLTKKRSGLGRPSSSMDAELNDYFVLMQSKKKKGRPPKSVKVYDDDPVFEECLSGMQNHLSGIASVAPEGREAIPFLPPSLRTMEAYRTMLRFQSHFQGSKGKLPNTKPPAAASRRRSRRAVKAVETEAGDDRSATESTAYNALFAKFAALFFWPAVLSTVKPKEAERELATVQRPVAVSRRVNYGYGRKRKQKRKAPDTAVQQVENQSLDETLPLGNGESTSTVGGEEQPSDEPPAKRRKAGRPKGSKNVKRSEIAPGERPTLRALRSTARVRKVSETTFESKS